MRRIPAFWVRLGLGLPALVLLVIASARTSLADDSSATSSSTPFSAEAVRAAYVVNFIRFTEWPADAISSSAPFIIGVAGSRALEDELIRLADHQFVRERRLRIVRIKKSRDLDACHAVYFDPAMEPGEEPSPTDIETLPTIRSRPILTISESPDFLRRGGMVNLYRDGGNLRFEISPDATAAAGLVLSSRLLALARIHRSLPALPPDTTTPPTELTPPADEPEFP